MELIHVKTVGSGGYRAYCTPENCKFSSERKMPFFTSVAESRNNSESKDNPESKDRI